MKSLQAALWCLAAWGCTEGGGGGAGDGGGDGGPVDARPDDAGPMDASPVDAGPGDTGPVDAGLGDDGGGPECSAAVPCDDGFECEGGSCVPVEVPQVQCVAGDPTPPCNGCPAGTVVPPGFGCAPAGTFTQGEVRWTALTRPVTLTRPFFIQTTEVTQGEWRALMGTNPSLFPACGDTCPVETVTWNDAVAYANAKSAAEGLAPCYDAEGGLVGGATPYDCAGYRLPTEAEWEYAYRAGTQTIFYWGDAEDEAGDHAWFFDNAGNTPQPVGTKSPNAWGLHDMAGNVGEWVQDWFENYPAGAATDPWGQQQFGGRVDRGGNWAGSAEILRAAIRGGSLPSDRRESLGFRLARSGVP